MQSDEQQPGLSCEQFKTRYEWKNRVRFMYVNVLMNWAVVAYCLLMDKQSALAETAVTTSLVTIFGTVGAYVFGATWRDVTDIKQVYASRGTQSQP